MALSKQLLVRRLAVKEPSARVARTRYLAMIDARVSRVRRVARYVFRASPEIVREVTSAHTREQRRADRRRVEEDTPVVLDPASESERVPAGPVD